MYCFFAIARRISAEYTTMLTGPLNDNDIVGKNENRGLTFEFCDS